MEISASGGQPRFTCDYPFDIEGLSCQTSPQKDATAGPRENACSLTARRELSRCLQRWCCPCIRKREEHVSTTQENADEMAYAVTSNHCLPETLLPKLGIETKRHDGTLQDPIAESPSSSKRVSIKAPESSTSLASIESQSSSDEVWNCWQSSRASRSTVSDAGSFTSFSREPVVDLTVRRLSVDFPSAPLEGTSFAGSAPSEADVASFLSQNTPQKVSPFVGSDHCATRPNVAVDLFEARKISESNENFLGFEPKLAALLKKRIWARDDTGQWSRAAAEPKAQPIASIPALCQQGQELCGSSVVHEHVNGNETNTALWNRQLPEDVEVCSAGKPRSEHYSMKSPLIRDDLSPSETIALARMRSASGRLSVDLTAQRQRVDDASLPTRKISGEPFMKLDLPSKTLDTAPVRKASGRFSVDLTAERLRVRDGCSPTRHAAENLSKQWLQRETERSPFETDSGQGSVDLIAERQHLDDLPEDVQGFSDNEINCQSFASEFSDCLLGLETPRYPQYEQKLKDCDTDRPPVTKGTGAIAAGG